MLTAHLETWVTEGKRPTSLSFGENNLSECNMRKKKVEQLSQESCTEKVHSEKPFLLFSWNDFSENEI